MKQAEDQQNPPFNEHFKFFTFDGTEDGEDLMEFFLNNREIITNLINSEFSNAAKKVQFAAFLQTPIFN